MRTRRSQSSGNSVSPNPSTKLKASGHTPVLLHEALNGLELLQGDVVVDATLGGAGHARAIAERLGVQGVLIGFDLDADAIERAHTALKGVLPRIHLVQANFRTLADSLEKLGISYITKALFDLGWSSYQLDSRLRQGYGGQAGRGFSFDSDAPLLMTYAKHPGPEDLTASTIVNEWAEGSLADIIFGWGQERFARRIARAIVAQRAIKPIATASELAEIVRSAYPGVARRGRTHPATKTFQALRIAVNDELGALTEGVQGAWRKLSRGGRIAVISFHSLEDGLVKRMFVELEKKGEGKRITRKPIAPSEEEVAANPRARSAKLRVIEKL